MRLSTVCAALLVVSSALGQTQMRTKNQEKLVQYLTTDLQLSQDQVTQVRSIILETDKTMDENEAKYFSNPGRMPYIRKQIIMDMGKKIEGILTTEQLAQYPKTKQKLYDLLQSRYQGQIQKEQQEGAKANEMQQAEPREVK
ncbi:MAG TPA: hypothetical protein VMM37_03460 [Bacteroidota bacterium]|nr:hypothetical protein [Bacteroidota bacterium]